MATELGQAYVQIMPSAKGISGKIKDAINPEATSAGQSAGSSIASGIKKAIAAAGIGMALKTAIFEGANLEQSYGGIETMFKETADTMKKYADEAYKTVGISANEYMTNVTSFSASLLQSLGGDTAKAGEVANRAMIDMGDNANKFGTDMKSIQNAYQGFAKQNYTMLDNLKLGYGGTKTEMQRLLKDAQALSGVEYNIENLSDVYTAIGVIQDQLGVTGTTALEAEETLTGSLNAMKSAFTNTLGKLALGEDIKPSLQALASTVSTFLFDNFLPMVWNIFSALPGGIVTFLQEAAPRFLEAGGAMLSSLLEGITTNLPIFLEGMAQFLESVIAWIQTNLPTILQEGVSLITEFANGIFEGMPEVIASLSEILTGILTAILEALPMLVESGMELIRNLAIGIWNNLPEIVSTLVELIGSLLDTLLEHMPDFIEKGLELVGSMIQGIWNNLPEIISTIVGLVGELISAIRKRFPEFIAKGVELIGKLAIGLIMAIPGLVAKIPQIIVAVVKAFGSLVGQMAGIGGDIVRGLWKGISNVKNWILGKIGGFVDNVVGGIKKFFGIGSPSKVMAKEVGRWLPEGLAVGVDANIKPVMTAMDDLADATVDGFNPDLSMSTATTHLLGNDSLGAKLERVIELLDESLKTPPSYQMVMDSGALVGELTPPINKELEATRAREERGN